MLTSLVNVTGLGLHAGWTDLYTPNAPAIVPNLDPGNYTAAFLGLSSFRTYGARGAIIAFAMPNVAGTPRFMHWYLAYQPSGSGVSVPEVLQRIDNGVYQQEVQADLTHFRRVDASGANSIVYVPINFPAWAGDTNVIIFTRREFGWAGAQPDFSSVAVALSDDPLDLNRVQALYSAQKGTTAGGLGITGTVIDANHNALDVNVAGGVVLNADLQGQIESLPAPSPSSIRGAIGDLALLQGPAHELITRGAVLTDEGAFEDDYHGGSDTGVALTGTSQFTNGSTAVVGTGSLYTTEVRVGDYVELAADDLLTAPKWAQVDSIQDNLHLTLREAYTGAGGAAGASLVSHWLLASNDATAVFSSANSYLVFTQGIVVGAAMSIARGLGAGGRKASQPMRLRFTCNIDQRRNSQSVYLGVFNSPDVATATAGAWIQLRGTDATQVRLRTITSAAAGDGDTKNPTLPNALTTVADLMLEIRRQGPAWTFYAGTELGMWQIGDQTLHVNDPYERMWVVVAFSNEGVAPAGATVFSLNELLLDSFNDQRSEVSQPDESKLRALVKDILPFSGSTPRAPTNIADNLVHEITDAAGNGMDIFHHYCIMQIGGADIQVYQANAAPAVATVRRSPFHLFNGIPWMFSPSVQGQRLWAARAVDGTAAADVYCDSVDGGAGF